ncbi:MAG: hypothetical protein J3Q66DRAFT_172888 [Benniella sp.]|nr:MAG: hypothetical protein J3Q66DRAFT_172888 [Benniella sp.]
MDTVHLHSLSYILSSILHLSTSHAGVFATHLSRRSHPTSSPRLRVWSSCLSLVTSAGPFDIKITETLPILLSRACPATTSGRLFYQYRCQHPHSRIGRVPLYLRDIHIMDMDDSTDGIHRRHP